MSKEAIQPALDKMSYGVSVVTVGRGGAENGLTVSWLSQVSFDPPLLMIAVDRNHYSVEFLESTKNFTVNLLREDQGQLAGHFAKPSMSDEAKIDGVATHEAESGAAILSDALAYIDCELVATHDCGDHRLFIGQAQDAGLLNEGAPLTTAAGARYRKPKSTR